MKTERKVDFNGFYSKLKELAISQKESCDIIKKHSSPIDGNYLLEWGKCIAYFTVLKEIQQDLGIEEQLLIEVDYDFKELLS